MTHCLCYWQLTCVLSQVSGSRAAAVQAALVSAREAGESMRWSECAVDAR
jgi:hypothetical protein